MASEDRTRVRFAPGSQILSAESLRTGYPDMTSDGIRRPQHERLIWTGIDNQALDSAEDDEDVFKYRPQVNMADLRKTPPSSKVSLFTNFEDVQLTDEERVFINGAAVGDVPIIRQSLEETEVTLNVNCVDYMGRNALHLAVDSESMEVVEMLLDKLNFECIEEALLHAISKGSTKIVKCVIEHPNYIAGEDQIRRAGVMDPFFRTEEKSQFSPDITPLILSAHYNNHEIIQMFLSRNHTIDKPHPISCQCTDCVTKQNYDSLKRSRSRLNAYRALASPAYMALSSPDPIMTTFRLRQEMQNLSQVEKEFKNEYLALVEQCMDFACELIDLCRGTQEVEAVLSEGSEENENGTRDPLARLKMAMQYEEKKFVAHPNCQQHLTTIWYGPEMGFMQSMILWKQILMYIVCVPLCPLFCLFYIITPDSKLGNALRCPASKFITHTLSHLCFLILLAAATFRLEDKTFPILSKDDFNATLSQTDIPYHERIDNVVKSTFRPANILMTHVQICLMFWVLGLLWMECKQMYSSGVRIYLLDNYNWMDYTVLSLYLSSYVLRFLVDHWIKDADLYYNGTARAWEALEAHNLSLFKAMRDEMFDDPREPAKSYFMQASRFEWRPDDPEIVSDVLFAVANVLSIARTTYLMPAFEVLGPLQISLGRMIGDITRILVLFTLVLFAFMVGLHNLYWYYGSRTYKVKADDGSEKILHASEAFQGLPHTLFSLFWSMFGLITVDSVEIKYPQKKSSTFPGGIYTHATSIVENVGMLLFALYHVVIIIVLINMLIAMMSHSFEDIQGDCDVEWKFARTRLWMNYIDEGSTLPVPFNMIPSPKSCRYARRWIKDMLRSDNDGLMDYERNKRQTFIMKRREDVCESLNLEAPETSYCDILQRLVRRYLFKLERNKDEGKDSVNVGPENILTGTTTEAYSSSDNKDDKEPAFADSEDADDSMYGGGGLIPPAPPGGCNDNRLMKSRAPQRSGGGSSLRPARTGRRPSVGSGPPQVQLLSIPQLDAIQRSLKLLDVRLQHIQTSAKDDEKSRDNIDHIRRVMSENQKALSTVVTVLSAIQEEVRSLSIAVHHQQKSTLQIQAPRKRSSERSTSSGEGLRDREGSSSVKLMNDTMDTAQV